jgi:glycosyltransferase involved in cell wall biosynthesis
MKSNPAFRRLLVITYHFPPDGTIGGQRWAGLSKYLSRLGWEVHVITAAAPGQEQTTNHVHRHVRHRRRTLSDAYDAAVGRFRRSPRPGHSRPTDAGTPQPTSRGRASEAARRIASALMHLPDGARGWIGRAAGAARGLLRERKFDAVISCGPPHSAHFAALLATRGIDTSFWIDMRDPWSVTHHMNLPDDRLVLAERWFLRRLERLVFPHASRVIVNTREFAASLRKTDPDLDVVWLPNGIDLEQMPRRDPRAVERGSITYVGTLYAGRNLSMVFAGIRELLKDRPEAASMLRVNVAGPMESRHREQMEKEIASMGLASIVKIYGVLPRSEALELLSRSHLALVLAQDQPMCVPAKLYECVGLCIPTLVIAEPHGAAAVEARRIGAMTLGDDDVDGMRSVLNEMLSGRLPTTIEPTTRVSYADLAAQMDRLLRESESSASSATR